MNSLRDIEQIKQLFNEVRCSGSGKVLDGLVLGCVGKRLVLEGTVVNVGREGLQPGNTGSYLSR